MSAHSMQKREIVAPLLVPADQQALGERFIPRCVRSTTHRRALKPASCLSALAASPAPGGGP